MFESGGGVFDPRAAQFEQAVPKQLLVPLPERVACLERRVNDLEQRLASELKYFSEWGQKVNSMLGL